MISIREAATLKLKRIRRPKWANPMDHIELLYDGVMLKGGVPMFGKFYGPFNKECNGRDPLEVCIVHSVILPCLDAKEFVEYAGPLPDSDEYRAAVSEYEGCLS